MDTVFGDSLGVITILLVEVCLSFGASLLLLLLQLDQVNVGSEGYMVMLLDILLTDLVEVLDLFSGINGSTPVPLITSLQSISTMAGLMTALDLSASLGLHTLRISIPVGVCVASEDMPSVAVALAVSSSKELRVDDPSETESCSLA